VGLDAGCTPSQVNAIRGFADTALRVPEKPLVPAIAAWR
jgi:hypothetical protein